jgi:hypothetical protein
MNSAAGNLSVSLHSSIVHLLAMERHKPYCSLISASYDGCITNSVDYAYGDDNDVDGDDNDVDGITLTIKR